MWVGQTAAAESYWDMWPEAALFATLLLAFLGTHEFGHYFAAVYHNVKVTLPYFIPSSDWYWHIRGCNPNRGEDQRNKKDV
jgi:hypothetical protein